jgi:DNA mismatch repair ATPase MutS
VKRRPLQSILLRELHPLPHVVELLSKAIVDEPPGDAKDGGMFRDGYSPQLDELRSASREGKNWIAQLQERLSEENWHQIAEGPIHQCLRVFHRDHQIEPRVRSADLAPKANRGQW